MKFCINTNWKDRNLCNESNQIQIDINTSHCTWLYSNNSVIQVSQQWLTLEICTFLHLYFCLLIFNGFRFFCYNFVNEWCYYHNFLALTEISCKIPKYLNIQFHPNVFHLVLKEFYENWEHKINFVRLNSYFVFCSKFSFDVFSWTLKDPTICRIKCSRCKVRYVGDFNYLIFATKSE